MGGGEYNRKIAWVSWETMCKSRKEGGLGVKDLGRFNLALLGKWQWRLLRERRALWNRIMEAKYGVHRKQDYKGREVKANSSNWWKELWKIDRAVAYKEGWL
ncbi:hypothetical protein SLEP1_g24382 [Rubroshorea leprosula]|uniref:Uncharacterized protein n=1 Tax=Rubroshorea leprosula TaxID=152421 RepID=A0AAV5JFJ7_9ROSI|nr:hypothetical protein SLEP1_g24382 [Rubroshorea leprosula]